MTPSRHTCTHRSVHTECSASLTSQPFPQPSRDHLQMCTPCSHLRIKTGGGVWHREGGDSPMKIDTASRGWEEDRRKREEGDLDSSCVENGVLSFFF